MVGWLVVLLFYTIGAPLSVLWRSGQRSVPRDFGKGGARSAAEAAAGTAFVWMKKKGHYVGKSRIHDYEDNIIDA